MKEAFEKILERLEESSVCEDNRTCNYCQRNWCPLLMIERDEVEKIVNEVSEEYNDGWIAISDRFPENEKYILLSFDNFSVPMIGRYESYESGGAFYIGDEDITCSKQDLFVNAWQPLPEPYQPKGE